MGTIKQLRSLCARLLKHAFELPSLAADILGFIDKEAVSGRSWVIGGRTIDMTRRACIMGILNVTPDSFSDGNRFFSAGRAV